MCNLSQGIEDRILIQNILSLMDTLHVSIEEAMDLLSVEESKRDRIKSIIYEMK